MSLERFSSMPGAGLYCASCRRHVSTHSGPDSGMLCAGPSTIDVARAAASMVAPPGMIATIRERVEEMKAREASQERALAEVESAATVVQDGHEGTGPAIWDLLIAELLEQSQKNPRPAEAMALRARVAEDGRARDAFGVSKYGRRLRAYDGRDPLVDAIQELLDASVYFRKAVYEGRACEGLYEQALRLTIATRAQIEADAAQGIGGPIAAPPSGMPSSAPLGRVAYDAYRARRGGVAYDGTAIPEWPALRPEIREAWCDAAAAVIGARSTQPGRGPETCGTHCARCGEMIHLVIPTTGPDREERLENHACPRGLP